MTTMASQITSLTIVSSTVYSVADQRKHQSSASLAFVWGVHRGPVNSPHKWPVTRKMFPFDDVIMPWSKFCSTHLVYTSDIHHSPHNTQFWLHHSLYGIRAIYVPSICGVACLGLYSSGCSNATDVTYNRSTTDDKSVVNGDIIRDVFSHWLRFYSIQCGELVLARGCILQIYV